MDYADDGTGLRVTSYVLALQAAIAGEGVVLGWSQIVDPMLEQGLLVPVGGRRLRTDRAFHLLWPAGVRLSANAKLVSEWMVEAAVGPKG